MRAGRDRLPRGQRMYLQSQGEGVMTADGGDLKWAM